jgi:hypothetical protein
VTNSTHPQPAPSPDTEPTFAQTFGKVTISQLWKSGIAICVAIAALLATGFNAGIKYGETLSQEKLNSSSAQLAASKAEMTIQTERSLQLGDKLKNFIDYSTGLSKQIAQQSNQILSLSDRLGRTNTCAFLQQQIDSVQRRIENIGSGTRIRGSVGTLYFGSSEEQRKRDSELRDQDAVEIGQSQQQLLAFTQQLNACAK